MVEEQEAVLGTIEYLKQLDRRARMMAHDLERQIAKLEVRVYDRSRGSGRGWPSASSEQA